MTAPDRSEPTAGRQFLTYVGGLSLVGVVILAAMVQVEAAYGAVPVLWIAVLYLSIGLARAIGPVALVAPLLTTVVWFVAALALITVSFDGPNEEESEGWSALFAILGIGFGLIVAEVGVVAGLIWRGVQRRRKAAAETANATGSPAS